MTNHSWNLRVDHAGRLTALWGEAARAFAHPLVVAHLSAADTRRSFNKKLASILSRRLTA